jgi:hypothetical protein
MTRDYSGSSNPHYGKKGKNQFTDRDWSAIPWNEIGKKRQRSILMDEVGHKCCVCGFDKIRADGFSILQIDHIDGDHGNNARDNLRVVCPNCHALTSPKHLFMGRHHTVEAKDKISKGARSSVW